MGVDTNIARKLTVFISCFFCSKIAVFNFCMKNCCSDAENDIGYELGDRILCGNDTMIIKSGQGTDFLDLGGNLPPTPPKCPPKG